MLPLSSVSIEQIVEADAMKVNQFWVFLIWDCREEWVANHTKLWTDISCHEVSNSPDCTRMLRTDAEILSLSRSRHPFW
jgi:hypothetical protein